MSKIVQAVNAMISNKKMITDIILIRDEIFFLFRDKYVWSARRDSDSGEFLLWHYPGASSVENIASKENEDWEEVPMVVYKTSDIGTREARASFSELYSIVKERVYKMDEVLDDIISDSDS
jgi:hypothetical protein